MIHIERQVIRLVCERCNRMSPLHFHGVDHARAQMMAIELREGPWRCLPNQSKGGVVEDVCGDCVRKQDRQEEEHRAKVLAKAEADGKNKSANRKV